MKKKYNCVSYYCTAVMSVSATAGFADYSRDGNNNREAINSRIGINSRDAKKCASERTYAVQTSRVGHVSGKTI